MVRVCRLSLETTAHAGNLLQLALHRRGIELAIRAAHFDQHRFAAARAALQIAHRVRGDHLPLLMMITCSQVWSDFRQECACSK